MSYPIKFKRLHPDAVLPEKLNENAGYDLVLVEDFELPPFIPKLIPVGFSTEFPMQLEGVIRPRGSSLPKRRIHVAIGTVDSGFRNEWCISAMYIPILTTKEAISNLFTTGYRPSPIMSDDVARDMYISGDLQQDTLLLRKGERIAQVVFQWLPQVEFLEVEELGESIRNMGGFGSSGQ